MQAFNPIQILLQEHDVISNIAQLTLQQNLLWDNEPEKYVRNIETLLTFLTKYADEFHHHKEEAILFKALRELPEFTLDSMIDELEYHHQTFREKVQEIKVALSENQFQLAQAALRNYLENLLDHIAIENDELFVMSDNILPPKELERMYFQFLDTDEMLGVAFKKDVEDNIIRVFQAAPANGEGANKG